MVVRTGLMDIRASTTIVTSISRPLAITMTISVTTISITTIVSMESLWASMGVAGSMAIAISWLSFSRPLAITMTISTISISTIVAMKTLRTPVCVAAASIGMESYTAIAIARLSSGKAGKGHNNGYNLSCHGYKCIPSSVR